MKGITVHWSTNGNTAAQFTARPARWQLLLRAQSTGTRFPNRASLHQPRPMAEAAGPVRNIFMKTSGSAAFKSVSLFRCRLRSAIQSPSPAFDQPNPAATESRHDKECDSFRHTGGRAPAKRTPPFRGHEKKTIPEARRQDECSPATACSHLRFIAILQLFDSAARSFPGETQCRCKLTTER